MTAGKQIIDGKTLLSLLDKDGTRVIDCRFDLGDKLAGQRAYRETHIPGAVFADLEGDLSSEPSAESGRHPLPNSDSLAEFFGRCGIDSDVDVVVYDAGNGAMAARCWWLLKWLGHDNVRLLDGGFAMWQAAGLPLEKGIAEVAEREFFARPDNAALISTAEILDAYPHVDTLRLFDARDRARFIGDVEPIDPVAGHIPGAVNLPLTESISASGAWKSVAELQALWSTQFAETEPDALWAVMCGSGVTACHLALSASQAGFRAPRLYAGSWSEWIRDPKRPVATGSE